jgi:ribonuclease E
MKTLYVRINPRTGQGSFWRCGIQFSQAWQPVRDLDDATAQRLEEEQMLEVTETRPAELADDVPAGDSAVAIVSAADVAAPPVFAPDVEAPVVEASVVEASVVEASVVEAPVVEAKVVEAPVVEAPVVEAPVVEASVVEAPVVEAQVVEAQAATPAKKKAK